MAQIIVDSLSFSYDTNGEDIFRDVSFAIDTDWRLGFIGRNGRGKTTFLKLLMGEYQYSGKITSPVRFEYFPFEVSNKEQAALTVVREAIAPYAMWEQQMEEYLAVPDRMKAYGEVLEKFLNHDGYTINEMIEKELRIMGLNPHLLTRRFDTLSGGEQSKLLLIALFLKKNSFLLIDEPTNHLDSEGRTGAAAYLKGKKGFIAVSHDRCFLDSIADHILSVNKTDIEIRKGNFTTWQMNKDRQDDFERAEDEKLKKDIQRLKQAAKQKAGWSDRSEAAKFGAGPCDRGFIGHKAAKVMKRSKSIELRRQKAVTEKSKLLKNIETSESLKLIPAEVKKGYALEICNLQVNYGKQVLFHPLSFTIKEGECVWLRGENGCGKSSIFKLLAGEKIPYSGTVRVTDKISYISQDTSCLKGRLETFIMEQGIEEKYIKSTLDKLGLENNQYNKNVDEWSEGQKKKLLIAKSLCEKAELYIWDEPLNFIDVISRIQIEQLILREKPTMLFVEHDSTFGEKIATGSIKIEKYQE